MRQKASLRLVVSSYGLFPFCNYFLKLRCVEFGVAVGRDQPLCIILSGISEIPSTVYHAPAGKKNLSCSQQRQRARANPIATVTFYDVLSSSVYHTPRNYGTPGRREVAVNSS